MTPRFLGLSFQFDTNRINARQKLPAMNQLKKWRDEEVIELLSSAPVIREATAGDDPRRTAEAYSYVFTLDTAESADEIAVKGKIEQVLFPGGAQTDSDRQDVRIVAHARKHRCILVTNDGDSKRQPGGILGHRQELAAIGVTVMTDEEAAVLVAAKIAGRDEAARHLAKVTGEPLPEWVGCD